MQLLNADVELSIRYTCHAPHDISDIIFRHCLFISKNRLFCLAGLADV